MFNRIKLNIVFTFLIIGLAACLSQSYSQSTDSEYAITAYVNGGYSRFISELEDNDLNKNGFSGTIRLMWEPEHMLSIGIESGYINLYQFDTKDASALGNTFEVSSSLTAVPVLTIFSMRLFENFRFSVGSGIFILTSKVDALGNPVKSDLVSTGALASGSYYYPLSGTISLGGEIKYYLINKIEDGSLNFQFSLQYRFFTY